MSAPELFSLPSSTARAEPDRQRESAESLALVGLGNIGGYLVPHMAKMRGLRRVVLVDRDVYERSNLTSQDIGPHAIGLAKAEAQAQRLRALNPELEVIPLHAAIEDVPLGRLRADVILTGLDGRLARYYVNRAARRLGVPWIDAGVDARTLSARVQAYLPGPDAPCMECAFSDRDYALLAQQSYPCNEAQPATPAPTNAPSALGALAAALEVLELQKLLSQAPRGESVWRQAVLDCLHLRFYATAFRRNPNCKCEHEPWRIEETPCSPDLPVSAALDLGRQATGLDTVSLRPANDDVFVTTLTCQQCHATHARNPLLRRRLAAPPCPACGGALIPSGFHLVERLSLRSFPAALDTSLADLGFQPHDIFEVGGATATARFIVGSE